MSASTTTEHFDYQARVNDLPTDLPVWQRQRVERFIEAMQVEMRLGEREVRFLTWLASFDYDVEAGFLAVVEWLRDTEAEDRDYLVDRLKVIRRAATIPGVTADE